MKKTIILSLLGSLIIVFGCEKPESGYLSENIFYNTNPFEVEKGVTQYSTTIVGNGSSTPLNVDLIKVVDSTGEDVTNLFTEPQSIVVFKNAITWQDSTLELLQSKLKDSLVRPFQVNPIGGRLEFTAATSYLPAGEFSIDVSISNVKGSRKIKDACGIVLGELSDTYAMNYKRVTTPSTGILKLYETGNDYISIDVKYTSGVADGSWCIYEFLDKNGDAFNPLKKEVTRKSTSPFFDNWNPWYPVTKTDSAFVQQMPGYAGIQFPYFNSFEIDGEEWSDVSARYDWVITKGSIEEIDENLNGLISFQFKAPGTFVITIHLHQFTRADN